MSFPNIPNITATISVSAGQALSLLIASVALEELGLSHIINSEAEKLQMVLGTLPSKVPMASNVVTIEELLAINKSIVDTINTVGQIEMMLQGKLGTVLAYSGITPK